MNCKHEFSQTVDFKYGEGFFSFDVKGLVCIYCLMVVSFEPGDKTMEPRWGIFYDGMELED